VCDRSLRVDKIARGVKNPKNLILHQHVKATIHTICSRINHPPIASDNQDIPVHNPKKSRHTQSELSGPQSSTTERFFSIQVISSQLCLLTNPNFQPEDEQRMKELSSEVKIKLLESHVSCLKAKLFYATEKVKRLQKEKEEMKIKSGGDTLTIVAMWRIWKSRIGICGGFGRSAVLRLGFRVSLDS
jgi:hypothetical protein